MKFECFFPFIFWVTLGVALSGLGFVCWLGSGIHIPSLFVLLYFYHSGWVSLGMLLFVWFYYIFYLPLSLYTNNCSSYDSRTSFSLFFHSCLLIGLQLV